MARGLRPIPNDFTRPQPWRVDPSDLTGEFDQERDLLMVRIGAPRAALSVDIGGDVWARYIPETGEVIGFDIENFTRRYLAEHPEIEAAWEAEQEHAMIAGITSSRTNLLERLAAAFKQQFGVSQRGGALPA